MQLIAIYVSTRYLYKYYLYFAGHVIDLEDI